MTPISRKKLDALNALIVNDPQEALVLVQEYGETFNDDPNFRDNSGGFLIDIGGILGRPDLVQQGIDSLEDLLKRTGSDNPSILYNLGNGYSTLWNLAQKTGDENYQVGPDGPLLSRAKHYYRKALAPAKSTDNRLRAQLWVNYGNCLAHLGRAVEAISAYDKALKIVPRHPMAKGNMAVELGHFSKIAHQPVFLLDALEMLQQVLSEEDLGEDAGADARPDFERARDRIAAEIAELGIRRTAHREDRSARHSGYLGQYIDFSAKHHLFLNFCLDCRRCGRYAQDSLAFSLITGLDDNASFVRLSRVVNGIKESYAQARFLLYQAKCPSIDTIPIDNLTSYVDNLDCAVYGTRVASLKLAFESAYNIFDKIAHFLNDYLKLEVKPGPAITFHTNGRIWHDRQQLRPKLAELKNQHLLGLYDLARDLDDSQTQPEKDGYWSQLRRIRNALTHEYLIPHVELMSWAVEADEQSLHLSYTDFLNRTVDLLKLVRAAVIYLIAFIDLEERKKGHTSHGLLVPIPVSWYKPNMFASALDL